MAQPTFTHDAEAGAHTPRLDAALLARLTARVTADAERSTTAVHTPLTGELLGHVPDCTPHDVHTAVTRARTAQEAWGRLAFADRAAVLRRFHDLVLDRQREVLDLIQLESGKVRAHAFEEVADTAIVSRYYAYHGERHLRTRRRIGALPLVTATWEHHHPRGVVGFIAPWNYPLSMAITDAIPALLAGNAVVLKPDAQTPLTALWAVDLLYEAGLPADVFQVVTGRGAVLGTPMIERVDYVCFTGSTKTGRLIARQAGEHLIGCSLELGGKNPMLVLADAHVEKAADGAVRACFSSAGQLCISIERLYVHEEIFDAFSNAFVERVQRLQLGASLDFSAQMGSLISATQLETVRSHVDDAVAKGARVLAGGKPRPEIGPYFFEPTVLADVTPDMTLFAEETFGPVVALYRFRTVEEAIERANDTCYGLNASVWTRDTARGREIAARIGTGTVNINEAYAAAWASIDAPMGGFKDSGLGRRHGAEGILKYTESQTVAAQRVVPFAAPPILGEERYASLLTSALKLLSRIPGLR